MYDSLRPLSPVIPVFILIAIGFFFARFKKISLEPITEIVIYLGAPCLVFTSLASKPLFATDIAVLLAGLLGIIAGVGLLIWIYGLLTHFSSPGFTLPVLFMNAGNIGIPLALFAFGEPGLQRGTLLYVMITLVHNSLGLYLLGGKGGAGEIFRLPLIYAAVLGLLFNVAQIRIPEPIFQPLSLLGYSVIPLMLLSLGYRLCGIRSLTRGHSIAGRADAGRRRLRCGLSDRDVARYRGARKRKRLTHSERRDSCKFALRLQGSPVQIRRGPATVMATKAAS
jgi:predicted permease